MPETANSKPDVINNDLALMYLLNIQGMNPAKHNQKWKAQSLEERIINTAAFIAFLIITETHLKPEVLDAEIHIQNYEVYRSDRADREKGGTAIYVHDSIVVNKVETFSDTFCQAVLIYNQEQNLVLIGAYRPPDTPEDSFINLLNKLESFCKEFQNPDIYLLGDLNFPNVVWASSTIKAGKSSQDNRSAYKLLEFMDNHLMIQHVEENTRADKNILDVVIMNNDDYLHNITVEKVKTTSDHDLVNCEFLNLFKKPSVPQEPYSPANEFDQWNWNKSKWQNVRDDLQKINWEQLLNSEPTVSQMNKTFNETVISVASKHSVKHNIKASNRKFIPLERRTLLKKKRRINSKINRLKYINHTNKPKEQIDKELKQYNAEKEKIETELKYLILEEQLRKEVEVLEKIKTNPKAFYSYAKRKMKVKSRIGPLKDKEGKLHSDPKNMSDLLQQQYKCVFSDPDTKTDSNIETNDNLPGIDDIELSEDDFITAINLVSPSAAAGPDKFPICLLKECKNELAKPLCLIWKRSLETGEIPEILREQTIIPIFKKGSKADPANYRPVSLTSHIIKLFERVLRKKIVKYIDENNIIVKEQYGFCSGKSCTTQLLKHFEKILEIIDNSANADVIYLDFSKAFDKVDHEILLDKVKAVGIKGKIHQWLRSFLSNRRQYVLVDNHKSEPEEVLSGVPQGTVLGPVLFILYINDLVTVIKHSYCMIFADDSKLIKMIESLEDRDLLEEDLQAVIEWAARNKMELNRLKFQLLSHGKSDNLKAPYKIDDEINLEKSEDVKDLGVTLSENSTFTTHINNIVSSAKRIASWTLRTFKSRSKEVVLLLYKTYVRPKLEYSCALWSPHLIKDISAIESVQRTVTAKIEGMETSNYWERLSAIDMYSLQRRRERYQIIHMWKIYQNIIPNELNLVFYQTSREGVKCRRPKINLRNRRISTLRNNFFTSVGPALFNVVPGPIKLSSSLNIFKSKLDKFLHSIPDNPPLPGYYNINNNSILEWKNAGRDAQQPIQIYREETVETTSIQVGPDKELAAV